MLGSDGRFGNGAAVSILGRHVFAVTSMSACLVGKQGKPLSSFGAQGTGSDAPGAHSFMHDTFFDHEADRLLREAGGGGEFPYRLTDQFAAYERRQLTSAKRFRPVGAGVGLLTLEMLYSEEFQALLRRAQLRVWPQAVLSLRTTGWRFREIAAVRGITPQGAHRCYRQVVFRLQRAAQAEPLMGLGDSYREMTRFRGANHVYLRND